MKKLLSILSSLTLLASTTGIVVSCGTSTPTQIDGKFNVTTAFSISETVLVIEGENFDGIDPNNFIGKAVFEAAYKENHFAAYPQLDYSWFTITTIDFEEANREVQPAGIVFEAKNAEEIPVVGTIEIKFNMQFVPKIHLGDDDEEHEGNPPGGGGNPGEGEPGGGGGSEEGGIQLGPINLGGIGKNEKQFADVPRNSRATNTDNFIEEFSKNIIDLTEYDSSYKGTYVIDDALLEDFWKQVVDVLEKDYKDIISTDMKDYVFTTNPKEGYPKTPEQNNESFRKINVPTTKNTYYNQTLYAKYVGPDENISGALNIKLPVIAYGINVGMIEEPDTLSNFTETVTGRINDALNTNAKNLDLDEQDANLSNFDLYMNEQKITDPFNIDNFPLLVEVSSGNDLFLKEKQSTDAISEPRVIKLTGSIKRELNLSNITVDAGAFIVEDEMNLDGLINEIKTGMLNGIRTYYKEKYGDINLEPDLNLNNFYIDINKWKEEILNNLPIYNHATTMKLKAKVKSSPNHIFYNPNNQDEFSITVKLVSDDVVAPKDVGLIELYPDSTVEDFEVAIIQKIFGQPELLKENTGWGKPEELGTILSNAKKVPDQILDFSTIMEAYGNDIKIFGSVIVKEKSKSTNK